ncbi:hypothetical protein E2562_016312 [Oryza meyeriana var. granulata]|uniref:DUF834 domain-containing protein n=1 Tax=Oryza meyeriana var. granulata TaxID=110450 RepID=A0A6G1DWX0_9ORYZ|nr:hypothetical protein E2562_016312 [Oryza meyeriana var. granulata]
MAMTWGRCTLVGVVAASHCGVEGGKAARDLDPERRVLLTRPAERNRGDLGGAGGSRWRGPRTAATRRVARRCGGDPGGPAGGAEDVGKDGSLPILEPEVMAAAGQIDGDRRRSGGAEKNVGRHLSLRHNGPPWHASGAPWLTPISLAGDRERDGLGMPARSAAGPVPLPLLERGVLASPDPSPYDR